MADPGETPRVASGKVFRDPFHFVAYGFGSGLASRAPGTAGSLAALPFVLLLNEAGWIGYTIILLATFALGTYASERVSRDLGVHDHGGIVIDEFVGMWLTCFMLPAGWYWFVIAFALFRFFDIVKPWPVNWFDEKVSGGFGIMLDDVVAGLYALACVQLIDYALARFL